MGGRDSIQGTRTEPEVYTRPPFCSLVILRSDPGLSGTVDSMQTKGLVLPVAVKQTADCEAKASLYGDLHQQENKNPKSQQGKSCPPHCPSRCPFLPGVIWPGLQAVAVRGVLGSDAGGDKAVQPMSNSQSWNFCSTRAWN